MAVMRGYSGRPFDARDPRHPDHIDTYILNPPDEDRPRRIVPVSIERAVQSRRVEAAADRVVRGWRDLIDPPSGETVRRRLRAAVYASAGRTPPVEFARGEIERDPDDAIARALGGEHITIMDGDERAAVLVAADEYAYLLDLRGQWETTRAALARAKERTS